MGIVEENAFLTDLQKILITRQTIFKSVNVVVLYDIDMMTNKQAFELSLKCPFTMLVSGPSGCGKSTFVRELIGPDKDIHSKPLGRVVWFYKTYQEIYETMKWTGEVEQFIEGMCTMAWISENVDKDENCTIVIDDLSLIHI